MDINTKEFILEHLNSDVHQLLLQSNRYPLVDMPLAIRQIIGRQKIRNKVPLFFNSEEVLYPVQLSLEQSSSEITARYKSTLCEGNELVDLTGGFGVDCFFMSLHFKQVTYVERQTELCELASHNFKVLGQNNVSVISTDSVNYLNDMNPVDWIYLDPARRDGIGKKVVFLSDCEPNVNVLASHLLRKAHKVLLKLSPMMDISAALQELPSASEVHIIAVENECKEILVILTDELVQGSKVVIKTVNFLKNNMVQLFDFQLCKEATAQPELTSELAKYMYEPNAAIMKSGGFKLISDRLNVKKLHKNTHLYTSDKLVSDFPGRIFEVLNVWDNSKKEFKNHLKEIEKANLSCRNYPLRTDELRKKLKIKDGGDIYIFACTLSNQQKVFIECLKAN